MRRFSSKHKKKDAIPCLIKKKSTKFAVCNSMKSKTYVKYIWLLNTLLQKEQSFKEIN